MVYFDMMKTKYISLRNKIPQHKLLIGLFVSTLVGFTVLMLQTPTEPIALKPPVKSGTGNSVYNGLIYPPLKDKTLESGLSFSHQQGDEQLAGIDETLGAGACALDYDHDGWVDLFLVNGSGQTRFYGKPYWWQRGHGSALFKNIDGRHFREVTQETGLTQLSWGMGCITADLDNDGDTDLLVTNRGENQLFRNEGTGKFTNVTPSSGIAGVHWSTSTAIADFNGDGLPDIYIANYVEYRKGAHTYETNSQFTEDQPLSFQGSLYQPQPKTLYQNLGNLQFKEVATELNADNREGRSLGVAWFDADGDNWPDVFLANDKGVASNSVLQNHQGKHFEPVGTKSGLQSPLGHRGIAVGDVNNDGLIDLAVTTERGNAPLLLVREDDSSSAWFTDKARDYGIGQETYMGLSGWSPGLADFNNDGWTDLFLTNGLVMPDPDTHRVPQGQPKQLWLNTGKQQFSDATEKSGEALMDNQSARGAVFADFDNDGDMDVYVAHNNDLGQLLVNELPDKQHWLGIELVGSDHNRDAVGARVVVDSATGSQTRQVTQGSGFLSDSDQRLHFGLGVNPEIKQLKIYWPDGLEEIHTHIPVDGYLRITQGQKVLETALSKKTFSEIRPQAINLKFGAEDPENRASYLNLVVKIDGFDKALPELEKATHDDNFLVRKTVVNLLTDSKNAKAGALLTFALNDVNADVAAAAVDGLCSYEDENAVRWLLRAFNNPDPKIKISLANCFGYYFQEEEAVVHRKYLAISPLIRLLADSDKQVAIAAADALAKAERYRAVAPLEQLLVHSNSELRTAGIRALGLIRDGSAIPSLLKILFQANESPQVYAQVFIALKRLDYGDYPTLLHNFVFGIEEFKAVPVELRLKTIEQILRDKDDGVVINPEGLAGLMVSWAKENSVFLEDRSHSTETSLLINILIASHSNNKDLVDLLSTLVIHSVPNIRGMALAQLLVVDNKHVAEVLNLALSDTSPEVGVYVFRSLKDLKITRTLPEKVVVQALNSKSTRLVVLEVAYLAPGKAITKKLGEIATKQSNSSEEVIAALADLERLGAPITITKPLLQHANAQVRRLAFSLFLNQLPKNIATVSSLPKEFSLGLNDSDQIVRLTLVEHLAIRPELWAKRKIATYLDDKEADLVVRKKILNQINVEAYQNILLNIAKNGRYDPLQQDVIEKLLIMNTGFADSFALLLLKDSKTNSNLRFKAARSIAPRNGQQVVKILQES